MNELISFNFEGANIRPAMIEGNPHLCGNDVATALGYAIPKDAIYAHCKGAVKYRTPTNGGMQELAFIPESDVRV